MEDNHHYRLPEGFNPFSRMNAIRGLTDAIHRYLFEGPGTEASPSHDDRAGLNALVELVHAEVHELHAYLARIENETHLQLPLSEQDFEDIHVRYGKVRETPPLYLLR